MKKNLIIRADANTHIGTGHVMRCIALAQAWQDRGGKVAFLSNCDSEDLQQQIDNEGFEFISIERPHPDPYDLTQTLNVLKRHVPCPMSHVLWLVLDGYRFTPEYQKAIRDHGHRLLVIDDMAHLDNYHADILLNQNIYAGKINYPCDKDTVRLLGRDYVMLRREFSKYTNWKREIPAKAKNILVTLGGADPDNVTLKVIDALNGLNDSDLEVKIVVGPSNPNINRLEIALSHSSFPFHLLHSVSNIAELMAWSDMAVSAGGSTCWELAFMGLPSILIKVADNQNEVVKWLDKAGIFKTTKWRGTLSVDVLSFELTEIIGDKDLREQSKKSGRRLIDGCGCDRVIDALIGLNL